jgi:hypothetical protein
MNTAKRYVLFATILALLGTGQAQQSAQAIAPQPAAKPTQTIPSYPSTTQGLEKMMTDMISLQEQDNVTALEPYLRSLVLPNADAWFTARFGDAKCSENDFASNDCMGPRLALAYQEIVSNLPASFALTLRDLAAEGLTNFEAVDNTEQCPGPIRINPEKRLTSTLSTSAVLPGLRKLKEPAFALWSYNATKETVLGLFVYSDGAFRYVGLPHEKSREVYLNRNIKNEPPVESAPRYLTEDQVEMSPLIDPAVIQRTVVVTIDLEKDGRVKRVSYVRGPLMYKDAAMENAKRLKFSTPGFGPYGFRPSSVWFNAVAPGNSK